MNPIREGLKLRLEHTFRALKYKNYRYYFIGQGGSLVGTWMQRLAMWWLVYRLTGSEVMLGIVGFTSQIMTFLLSPLAGAYADRHDPYKIFLLTQVIATLQALTLFSLVLFKVIAVWQIVVLSLILGFVNSFEMPARNSMVFYLVNDREDLPNAIALNSTLVNAARIIGPAIAGFLIALIGEGYCFLVNAISYLIVIFALLAMTLDIRREFKKTKKIIHDIRDGLRYTFTHRTIRSVILNLAAVSLVGMSYMVIMPVYVHKVINSPSPKTLGFLMTATGVGAMMAGFFLANKKRTEGFGRIVGIAPLFTGLSLIALSASRNVFVSLPLMFILGAANMLIIAGSNTILQYSVADEKRGRVMSIYTMAFIGMAPFGSLLYGYAAKMLSIKYAMACFGFICMLISFLYMNGNRHIGEASHEKE